MIDQRTSHQLRLLGLPVVAGLVALMMLAAGATAADAYPATDSRRAALQEDKSTVEPGAPAEPEEAIEERPAEPTDVRDPFAPLPAPDVEIPVTTSPPRVDPAEFGVGWPAAAAVGVALLAVVLMAHLWRRDQTW